MCTLKIWLSTCVCRLGFEHDVPRCGYIMFAYTASFYEVRQVQHDRNRSCYDQLQRLVPLFVHLTRCCYDQPQRLVPLFVHVTPCARLRDGDRRLWWARYLLCLGAAVAEQSGSRSRPLGFRSQQQNRTPAPSADSLCPPCYICVVCPFCRCIKFWT